MSSSELLRAAPGRLTSWWRLLLEARLSSVKNSGRDGTGSSSSINVTLSVETWWGRGVQGWVSWGVVGVHGVSVGE